jgi:hypothetical protein
MARIRTIKPEFWESPDTAAASPWARLLYIAMWNWADDYGVGKWTERELLAFAFPNDHCVTVEDFPSLVKEVADCFGTVFYINRGRRYYAIPAWDKHQKTERRAQGKYPTPNDVDSTPDQAFSSVAESVGSSEVVLGSSGPGKGTGEQGNREQGTGEQPAPSALEVLFDDAYSHWPKKTERKQSLAKFKIAARKIQPDLLAQHVKRFGDAYAATTERNFVPALSVWLGNERWNDDLPQAREIQRPLTNMDHNLAYVRSLMSEQSSQQFEIEGAA